VHRGADRLVPALGGRQIPDAKPERDFGMPADDLPRGVERAVDVA
jgi:hypothetical protein